MESLENKNLQEEEEKRQQEYEYREFQPFKIQNNKQLEYQNNYILPEWIENKPIIKYCLQHLNNTIHLLFLNTRIIDSNINYELEARLGKWNINHFKDGIKENFWRHIEYALDRLDSSIEYKLIPCKESSVWYYNLPDGREARTIVYYHPDSSPYITKEHMIKTSINKNTFSLFKNDTLLSDFRISLAKEEILSPEQVPKYVETKRVTNRQRRTFILVKNNEENWSYDITLSWSAKTAEKAELKQRNKPYKCSVEIELQKPNFWCKDMESCYYTMTSLVLKIIKLCCIEDFIEKHPFNLEELNIQCIE